MALITTLIGDSGEASSNQNNKLFWRTIWRLNVPNKVKSFMWRASKNILLTKVNLCSRKVIDDPICEACKEGAKSSGHIFWDCVKVHKVWQLTSIFFAAYGMVFSSFANFLWHLKFGLCLSNELLELVAMVAWSVWFSRNEARQGKARQQALAIVQKARLLLEEFHTANLKIP